MSPSNLQEYLAFAIKNRFNVLVTGKPGIGKSDIGKKAAADSGTELMISHPVVSDPTDYKGLPYASNGMADFLPFGDLRKLMETKVPLTWFIDDLGQAPSAVQASIMQILLEREINGKRISDNVSIIAATNRKEDKAGVTGILEPVKSRFASIVELEVSSTDWINWALDHDMPTELIGFIKFRPDLLDNFQATKDIVNSAIPRTVAWVGLQQNAGLPEHLEYEVFKGAAGEAFATEYRAFLKTMRDLPSVEEVIMNPTGAKLPTDPAATYAICIALASRANQQNIEPIITYLERLPEEFAVAALKDAVIRNREVANTRAYIKWGVKNQNVLI